MSKILFFSQVLPYPPDSGPKVRSYYTLRYLAQKHEVTLVTFVRPDDSAGSVDHLRAFCRGVHTVPIVRKPARNLLDLAAAVVTGRSFIILRDGVPQMDQLVERLAAGGSFDHIHADQLWMARYALAAARRSPGARTILDEHNACYQIIRRLAGSESNPLKRLALHMEWPKLRRYEAWALQQFDRVVAVTEEDRAVLEALVRDYPQRAANAQFETIPICVDVRSTPPVEPQANPRSVLHLGTMFWPPNVEGVLWFAREVWPQVRRQVPGAAFTIVGKNPPEAVKRLADGGAVQITGYAADPTPYLAAAAVFIVPLHAGSGMRVKIVDGWRWGLPIVSTRIGAEGICCRDGENILLADRPDDFAGAVARTLTDPLLAQRLRANGRAWVETHYDWQTVYHRWDSLYA